MLTLPANLEHRSHAADHFIRGEAGSGRPLPSVRPTWVWLWEANRCSRIYAIDPAGPRGGDETPAAAAAAALCFFSAASVFSHRSGTSQ